MVALYHLRIYTYDVNMILYVCAYIYTYIHTHCHIYKYIKVRV